MIGWLLSLSSSILSKILNFALFRNDEHARYVVADAPNDDSRSDAADVLARHDEHDAADNVDQPAANAAGLSFVIVWSGDRDDVFVQWLYGVQ